MTFLKIMGVGVGLAAGPELFFQYEYGHLIQLKISEFTYHSNRGRRGGPGPVDPDERVAERAVPGGSMLKSEPIPSLDSFRRAGWKAVTVRQRGWTEASRTFPIVAGQQRSSRVVSRSYSPPGGR